MENKELTMKWHKFLIYFALWAAALINLSNAGTYFAAAQVESIFAVCGVLMVILAVYGIVVRFALARFKAGAPKKLIILNICAGATGIVFPVLVSAATGYPMGELFDTSSIGSIVASFAMASCHKQYYDKRANMFVN